MRSNYLNPINYDPICNLNSLKNGLNTSSYSKNIFCKRRNKLSTIGKRQTKEIFSIFFDISNTIYFAYDGSLR